MLWMYKYIYLNTCLNFKIIFCLNTNYIFIYNNNIYFLNLIMSTQFKRVAFHTLGCKLNFSETLIPYCWNINWIPSKLEEMYKTLNSKEIPSSNGSCENCAYARQRSVYDNNQLEI